MANEVSFDWPTGVTLDFYRFQLNGDVFITDGSSDELWGAGGNDAVDYVVPMSEKGSSGHYVGDFDTFGNIAAGIYPGVIRLRAGVFPVDSDIRIGRGVMYWDGTAELNPFTLNTQIEDDVIGADGGSHADLSDQLDTLSSQKSQILNVYDET